MIHTFYFIFADSDEDRLRINVERCGLRIRTDVSKDGNCFFHAVSDQLRRTEYVFNGEIPSGSELRRELVSFISKLSPDDPIGEHVTPDYIAKLSCNGTWADAVAVQGMANMLNKNIEIVTSSKESTILGYLKHTILCNMPDASTYATEKNILLGHISEKHYISLEPMITQSSMSSGPGATDPVIDSDSKSSLFNSSFIKVRPLASVGSSSGFTNLVKPTETKFAKLEDVTDVPPKKLKQITDISLSVSQGPVQPRLSCFKTSVFGDRKRSFNAEFWYKKYSFLEYSESLNSVFCFPCRHFAATDGYADTLLTVTGCNDWKHLGSILLSHQNSTIHKNAVCKLAGWKTSQEQGAITVLINDQVKNEIEQNRSCLMTLSRVALLCARQDIALRGRENDKSTPESNKGNYLEILNLLKLEAPTVKNKLDKMPRNACYTSQASQNEFLACAASCVKDKIIAEALSDEGWYSVIVDEARDNRCLEQMSICIRYVFQKQIKERFLGFIDVHNLDAASLANTIEKFLEDNRLPVQKCVSQAYDGASVMSGCNKGVQVLFRNKTGHACPYVHCNAHRLNLVLVDVSKSTNLVSTTMGLLEAIYAFQSVSALRHDKMIESQKQAGLPVLEIPQQSDTRWVCKYRGVSFFVQRFTCVRNALKSIIDSKHKRDAAEARGLLIQLSTFETIFALTFLVELLATTNGLSERLQSSTQDFGTCMRLVASVLTVIRGRRTDEHFESLWRQAENVAVENDIPVIENRSERICRSSTLLTDSLTMCSTGQNQRIAKHEDKKTILRGQYFEVLDRTCTEMESRFKGNADIMSASDAVTPPSNFLLNVDLLEDFVNNHKYLNIDKVQLKYQCEVARSALKHANNPYVCSEIIPEPSSTDSTNINGMLQLYVKLLDMTVFPDLVKVIKLLLTIPVSTASAERSFSAMRRIKTYLRSTMGEDRLSALAILSIEKQLSGQLLQNPDEMVSKFANMKERRLPLQF